MRKVLVFAAAICVLPAALLLNGCNQAIEDAPKNSVKSVPPAPAPGAKPGGAVRNASQEVAPDPNAPASPSSVATSAESELTYLEATVDSTDRMKNGNFYRWDEGFAAPRHFSLGYDFLKLERFESDDCEDGVAAKQTWLETDSGGAFQRLFGQTLEDLPPFVTFAVEIRAYNCSDATVQISAVEMNEYESGRVLTGTPGLMLEREVVLITPGTQFQVYRGTFTTRENTTVKLFARVLPDSLLPCEVIWDRWSVKTIK
ncbi:MAG: hypothetical protein IT365_14825 [Candidatus Hydrogenedentes bacterium]|nr:hypothetical protein [Candidatus Hydrogenedentota bacterium]